MKDNKEAALQSILDKLVDGKKIFGTSFAIQHGAFNWQGAAGDLSVDQPYFIASTTKLFTTAIIFHLISKGQLALEDRIEKYFDTHILEELHVYKGNDYSLQISIKHLLAHSSGLADYFQGKGASGKSLEDEIKSGNDQYWSFEDAIERTKGMSPLFSPGAKHKANYSDANFQLLGKIIEVVTGKSYSENCQALIIEPLGLAATYLYQDIHDSKPKTLYYKHAPLLIPKAMTSFGADGGIVSTSSDILVFIEAFFFGKLFSIAHIAQMQVWNRIFSPMRSGIGIHLFKLPWLFNPTGAVPYFIGHSGLSGALAYYSPKENLYIAGTVNQIGYPDISFKTMIKLALAVLKK